jgi:hypothetical protein
VNSVLNPFLSRYSIYVGGSNEDGAYNIAVDPAGNAYLTSYTRSTDSAVVCLTAARISPWTRQATPM